MPSPPPPSSPNPRLQTLLEEASVENKKIMASPPPPPSQNPRLQELLEKVSPSREWIGTHAAMMHTSPPKAATPRTLHTESGKKPLPFENVRSPTSDRKRPFGNVRSPTSDRKRLRPLPLDDPDYVKAKMTEVAEQVEEAKKWDRYLKTTEGNQKKRLTSKGKAEKKAHADVTKQNNKEREYQEAINRVNALEGRDLEIDLQIKSLLAEMEQNNKEKEELENRVIIGHYTKQKQLRDNWKDSYANLKSIENDIEKGESNIRRIKSVIQGDSLEDVPAKKIFNKEFGVNFDYDAHEQISQGQVLIMMDRMKTGKFPGTEHFQLENTDKMDMWHEICQVAGLEIPSSSAASDEITFDDEIDQELRREEQKKGRQNDEDEYEYDFDDEYDDENDENEAPASKIQRV